MKPCHIAPLQAAACHQLLTTCLILSIGRNRLGLFGTCWDLEVNIDLKTQPRAEKVNVTLVGNWLWERPHSAHYPFFPQIWHHKMMTVVEVN
jgi:hypothetical protein